ncbi:polysaccharide deacetylase [Thermodesulfobium narugense DSM 14796]|uniref:Polysaccharide deacetylase n=1 Tax=Thermodesulfobium narugense DSM 14796 TaxID=747365 RepID=M1E4J2_9BACT|nr:polysaccharide deacetylase family protein [Thermodesulfobium narugense]AEE14212.1 polysaccharide deacetylase [Thermodesulfobium narugense DSM 14796]
MSKGFSFVILIVCGLLVLFVGNKLFHTDRSQTSNETVKENVVKNQNENIPPKTNSHRTSEEQKIGESSKSYSSRYEIDRAKGKTIVLTFDAGADGSRLPEILNILSENHVRATFFLTGPFCERYPNLVRKITAYGFEVGNHSYAHKDMTTMSNESIKEDILRAQEIIIKTTGQDPRPWFRPPYGARDDRVRGVLKSLGYETVYWTIDSLDWEDNMTVERERDRIYNNLKDGSIILLHIGSRTTPMILSEMIKYFESKGYRVTDLSGALR